MAAPKHDRFQPPPAGTYLVHNALTAHDDVCFPTESTDERRYAQEPNEGEKKPKKLKPFRFYAPGRRRLPELYGAFELRFWRVKITNFAPGEYDYVDGDSLTGPTFVLRFEYRDLADLEMNNFLDLPLVPVEPQAVAVAVAPQPTAVDAREKGYSPSLAADRPPPEASTSSYHRHKADPDGDDAFVHEDLRRVKSSASPVPSNAKRDQAEAKKPSATVLLTIKRKEWERAERKDRIEELEDLIEDKPDSVEAKAAPEELKVLRRDVRIEELQEDVAELRKVVEEEEAAKERGKGKGKETSVEPRSAAHKEVLNLEREVDKLVREREKEELLKAVAAEEEAAKMKAKGKRRLEEDEGETKPGKRVKR